MYKGASVEMSPAAMPQTNRYAKNRISAGAPASPSRPTPNSGTADPGADARNRTAAQSNPALRPYPAPRSAARGAPRMQPKRALETVSPESALRAVSLSDSG